MAQYHQAAVAVVLIVRRMRWLQKKQNALQKEAEVRELEMCDLETNMSDAKKDIAALKEGTMLQWKNIILDCPVPIAGGTYGEVWHGILNKRHEVAVKKMFNMDHLDALDNDSGDPEIDFLQRARFV